MYVLVCFGNKSTATGSRFTSQLNISATGSERGQKRGQNKARTRPENRAKTCEDRVSQQGGLSQPTGRLESANRKARVSQPGWRESDNQAASRTTRSRVRQLGRASDNPRVRQPGRESDTRSRASQPGHESANQVASQPTRSRVRQPVASLPVAFAWQAWDNVHCQGVGCTPRWLLRGRRGTMCTAKGSDVRPGVPLASLGLRRSAGDVSTQLIQIDCL